MMRNGVLYWYGRLSTGQLLILLGLAAVLVAGCTGETTPAASPIFTSTSTAQTPTATRLAQGSAVQSDLTATPGASAPTSTPQPQDTPSAQVTATAPGPSPVTNTPQAASPTSKSLPTEASAPTGNPALVDCQDQAVFVQDVSVPDGTLFQAGEQFVKTWRVKNSGTCDWGEGYSLVFAGGDIMNGLLNAPMPSIPAGEIGDISIDLQAPARGGEQTGLWKIQDPAGRQFGAGLPPNIPFWVKINVLFTGAASSATAPTPAPAAGGDGACNPTEDGAAESQVLDLINNARTANGLEPFALQSQLSAAALGHSIDMACGGFVDHNGSDGSTWQQRAAVQGYANAASARENIYVGDPAFGGNPQGAFNWWMNSQVHRDNILFDSVSEIGIGYVYLPGSEYGGYYTVLFARP